VALTPSRPAFGSLLRSLRIEAKLSQETLAERARVSVAAVSALERGVRSAPQRQTLDLLIEALGLEGAELSSFVAAAIASTKLRVRGKSGASVSPTPLPHVPTSFVGRERERDEIAELVVPGRCITLWGSGGIGKTRLALETARSIENRFPDGIRFVELAPVSDDSDVVRTTATVVGAREEDGREIAESVVRAFAGKRALLVLDNAEHVLLGCASLVDRLLRDLPALAILATTREPLRVHGEHVYAVEPLPIPSAEEANLALAPAIRLFRDRAARVGAPLDDSRETLRTIADICRRLDSIPLAIELAAARAPMMSVRQIASGLDDRFRLLTHGTRTATARQKTLYETLDWSYALASDLERIVLRRIAVWPGAWTLDDAVALAGTELSRWDVIEAVGGLVDRSLVVASAADHDAERRYSILQTTEAYALERARDAGELELGRRLQAEHTSSLVRAGFDAWRGGGEATGLLALDVAPVRAALRWTIALGSDPHMGAILAGRATIFWDLRAMHLEAMRWLDDALAILPADDDLARAEALIGRTRMLGRLLREKDAYDAAAAAIVSADRSGDALLRATARSFIADPAAYLGLTAEANRALDEAMALYERTGDERGREAVAWQSGWVAFRANEFAEAVRIIEPLVAKSRERGSLTFVAEGALALAEAEFALGRIDAASAHAQEGVAAARDAGATILVAMGLQNLAAYRFETGEVLEATALARTSLDLTFANGYDMFTTIAIGHLAEAIAHRGQVRASAVLLGYVDGRLQKTGSKRGPSEQNGYERVLSAVASALEPHDLARASLEGAALDEDEAVRIALDLTRDSTSST
jgi:predicted ATPase/DNA-binding XRE family transcriptional regulator